MEKFLVGQLTAQEPLGLIPVLSDALVDHLLVMFIVYIHACPVLSGLDQLFEEAQCSS